MGLGKLLERKLMGTPEERESKRRLELSLKREEEQARWEGKRKGTIERARKEGYRQGKQGSGVMASIANIADHINTEAYEFDNDPFGLERSHRKRSTERSHRKRSTRRKRR